MPPRLAIMRRYATGIGLFLAVFAGCRAPLVGQELPLLRDYPGSGRYQCPAPASPVAPDESNARRAAQLVSDANQALVLGDLERTQALLAQATLLDPTSADYAYRHALALAEVGDAENALVEYCRSLDLGIDQLGLGDDVRDRIDALYDSIREQIPEEARDAFVDGLAHADSSRLEDAADSFTDAIDAAPTWGAPVYNRGIVYEALGRIQESLADYRRYIDLAPTEIDPILVVVSERIGQLEGAASVMPPSPTGAFALGLVPGMGHYYTGRPLVGTLTLAAAGTSLLAGMSFKNIYTQCVVEVQAGQPCPNEFVVGEVTERPYLWYGIGIAATVTIVGAIDALIQARRRRSEALAVTRSGAEQGPTISGPSIETDGTRLDLSFLRVRFR